MIRSLLLIGLLFLFSCNAPNSSESLPYYASADFSPVWLADDQALDTLHSIAPFSFLNQDGDTISQEMLIGKIYVADFFFTVCPSICPRMTKNLMQVQEAFSADSNVMILSHSVMPWVDSVPRLASYAEEKGVQSPQWQLLTGDAKEIYQLARQSYFVEGNIGLQKDSKDFLHTESFVLVDGNAHIRGIYNGTIALEMERIIDDIKTLQKEH